MLPLSHIPLGSIAYALVKVVSIKDISKTKTDSYFQSIHAMDDSLEILITIFNKDQNNFTKIQLNDIILIKGKFSHSPFGNKLQASVFADGMVRIVTDGTLVDDVEIQDFKARYDAVAKVNNVVVSRKREFQCLKDVKRNMFFDLYALVSF